MSTDSEKMEPSGKVNLTAFADRSWFNDPAKSRFWLRIYTLLGVKRDEVSDKFANAIRSLHYELPIKIHYAYIGETEIPNWEQHLIGHEDGTPNILLKPGTKIFPGSTCVVISTPFVNDGVNVGPNKVTRALSVVPSLIAAHLGKNTLRDIIFNGSISAHDGQFSKIGTVTNIPKPFEGPTLYEFLWQAIEESITTLAHFPENERGRIELAIQFLERGIDEYKKDIRISDALLFYWIALEALCGGVARIETSLQNYYRLKDRSAVQTTLGTKAIRDWRNDLVHDGIKKELTPSVERYLQLMFLDILRYQLHLPPINLALSFADSPGVDLSPIGLANRGDAEKLKHISRMDFTL